MDRQFMLPAEASMVLIFPLDNSPHDRDSLLRAQANGLDLLYRFEDLVRIGFCQNRPVKSDARSSQVLHQSESLIRKTAGVGLPLWTSKIVVAFLSAELDDISLYFHFVVVTQTFHEFRQSKSIVLLDPITNVH
jgi:hypothetical protein